MKKYLVTALIIFAYLFLTWVGFSLDQSLKIYFLNIGQGDAILVKSPDNKYLLIDGGPDNTILSELAAVLPFWQRSIDLVVTTHADADHIGGLLDVSERYSLGLVVYNETGHNTELVKRVNQIWQERQIRVEWANADRDFYFGCCVKIDLLWPLPGTDLTKLETNDSSLTFILQYADFTAFFGGDLPKIYEERTAKIWGQKVEVLKVGHHGSKSSTSRAFLDLLQPKLAVISCGKNNRYGHPHQEILDLLNLAQITILRTDQVGRIVVTSSGNGFSSGFT